MQSFSSSKLFKSSTALHCNQFRVDSMKFIPVFCFAIISFHAETKQLNGKTNEIQSEIQRSERNLQVLSHLTSLESQVTCNTITKQSKHHNLSWERLMTEKLTSKKHLMTRVMRLRADRALYPACTRRTATSRATGAAWSATKKCYLLSSESILSLSLSNFDN